MFRHGEISTETDRAPFLFTLIALLACLAGASLLFVCGGGHALALFSGVLLAVVAAAAAAVLFAMVSDRAFIHDGALTMGYLFHKTQISLGDIARITYREEVYTVFDRRDNRRGTINARLTGIDRVIDYLARHGVPFQ